MWGKGSSKFVVGFPRIHATIITMKNKYTTDQLIGKKCGHGSPGYPTPEIIEAIVPYKGNPVNGFVNQELWQIHFESGCFTYLRDEDLQSLRKQGYAHYNRAAGFTALEVIEILG